MTQSYFPFDSGQGSNTTEAMWSKMAQNWLGTGVIKDVFNDLSVYANSAGMTVRVKSGAAWIKGHYFESDAEEILPIAAADITYGRIDRVVVRLDWTANTIQFAVLQGTPAASPTVPAVTQNTSRWEISLAQVFVGANVTSISAMQVTDERFLVKNSNYIIDSSGGVKINASGGTDDILAMLVTQGKGVHTFYNVGLTPSNPAGSASIRGMAHFSSASSGWVFAIDTNNNMYTNYYDVGTWKGWVKLTSDKLPSFTNLTLQNGATVNNSRTPKYTKIGNMVLLEGEISAGIANNTVIGTLPAGYRPKDYSLNFSCAHATAVITANAVLSVSGTGQIVLITSNTTYPVALNNIQFVAEV